MLITTSTPLFVSSPRALCSLTPPPLPLSYSSASPSCPRLRSRLRITAKELRLASSSLRFPPGMFHSSTFSRSKSKRYSALEGGNIDSRALTADGSEEFADWTAAVLPYMHLFPSITSSPCAFFAYTVSLTDLIGFLTRFFFPASGGALFGYDIGATSGALISLTATFPENSDDRLSNEMISTSRTEDSNHNAFTCMAVEIGSAILKVDNVKAVSLNGNGAHSSGKVQLKENVPQSFEEKWQSSNGKEANLSGQSTVLNTAEKVDRKLDSELSSLNEAETRIRENREQLSSSKVSESKSPSAVTLKKPITVSRPIYETTDMTDPPGALSDSNEDSSESVMSTDSGPLDLSTGLQALRRLIFRRHFDLAKDLAKKLYGQYPGDTDVLMEYAFVERQCGDLVAAGALYSQAISTYEDQNNRGYDYVRALQALGSIEAYARNARKARVLFMESIRAARQGERLFPEMVSGASVYGLHAWARLEEKLGNWSKARDLLARAAGIQPGNAVIHHSRALLEGKAHNWGAARHHFLLAVEAAPSDLKCWHAWAIFEGSQGHHRKMRLLFQRALEVDPKSVHCLQAWAHQETLVGTKESKQTARSLFERCVQIEPKSLHSWQAWAVMESASGNYDKARELFEKCLEISSSSVASLQAFATMERNLENFSSAQRLLRKALRLEPENAAVLMEAAFVEKGLGSMETAERFFVLAGMADKRKSRVRNKIFHSRKEVMPHKAGDKLWRAFTKKSVEKSRMGIDLETVFKAIKAKQQEVESRRDVNTEEQSSSTQREGGHRQRVWTPNRSRA